MLNDFEFSFSGLEGGQQGVGGGGGAGQTEIGVSGARNGASVGLLMAH